MPFSATVNQIVEILAAKSINLSATALAEVASITTDTRNIKPGDVFVALRGDRFDGQAFVPLAISAGAIAAIVTDDFESTDLPLLQVKDTLHAYQQIAQWWRKQFAIPVIGVTGSVGKTTTKELIAAVLEPFGKVLKTRANYNNEIGVPKTLLELGSEHQFAVIEMAMRASGEIALLTQITSPTIGVITNVGTAHIGRLGSEDAIARAKCELLAEMPTGSIAILNADNQRLMTVSAQVWQGKTITYGLDNGDLQGQLLDNKTISVGQKTLPLPLAGTHNASNFLAALAVAEALKIDWSSIAANLIVNMPAGRSQHYKLADDIVLLDETYNAGLESMLASLQLLAQTPGNRKIAVLGAMKELGEFSIEFHTQVGTKVKQLNLDALFVLVDGADAEAISTAAMPLAVECFTTHQDLVARLREFVCPGDRLLFKASHSIGLDRVVNEFRR
ncbi:MAG: UDP-N-acetylmuramoyl-tripeptide--D-alanyl-D-alanine ligase [Chroococcus sp. CMT-3BRIN-NPC107]|jgi:UDP-N-acetylmuramoyl-tripeptide--D-alanyl-D-alanine ligase|nr:UDP-N-acetylmuramoyl-tripeptide--D-alanyl-D-alanine ligase [Chroococcus sp. CMT-3BRIN-NPC107]